MKKEFERNFQACGEELTPSWFKVEVRCGERKLPYGPKFSIGQCKALSPVEAKRAAINYFSEFYKNVEVLKVTPAKHDLFLGQIIPSLKV